MGPVTPEDLSNAEFIPTDLYIKYFNSVFSLCTDI